MSRELSWYRVLGVDELQPGRVVTVTAGHRGIALTHFDGVISALDNRCPHQGGPLGEGSIEKGWLRCPWHGWDFHPCTGKPPGGFDDGVETFPVDIREDGIYVGVPEESDHVNTLSDLMAETMVAWGIRHCWGMVGHSNLGLADALRRQVRAGKLKYYGIRHEGAAAFAASGKLTGRPAACLAIAGPGATNLLTGLWDAHVDRAPVLALTGQVNTQVLGPGAFQEIDQVGAFGEVAQWGQTVLQGSRHTELVNLACKSAILNRGVSHLIFPDEVQVIPACPQAEPGSPVGRLTSPEITPPAEALNESVALLRKAERPVIIVGHGARFHMPQIIALAELLHAGVVTTFKGKGLIADDHPLGCGVLGRSGTPIASWVMNESDLLLVFGASFSDHTGITPKKPTIQVDFDPMMLGKFHAVDIPLWGEIGVTAAILTERLQGQAHGTDQRQDIAERWKIWRTEKARRANDGSAGGLSSAMLFAALSQHIPEDAIIAVDVGNNTYSFGRYFECKSQAVLMSGYLGSIGFALPAAFGAWAATQEEDTPFAGRKVVSISGDGGLGQYLADFTTAVKYKMNITHVVLHNGELGKISKEQKGGEWDVWETSLHNPSFAAYAELCGGLGIRVERLEELDAALTEAMSAAGPALVEVMTDPMLI